MLAKKDKEKEIQFLKDGKIVDLLPYVPLLADEIAVNAEKHHDFISVFDNSFPNHNSHYDTIPSSAFLTIGTISRLKIFSTWLFPLATTNPFLLKRLNFAVHTGKEGLFNEKKVRMVSKKYSGSSFVEHTNYLLILLFNNTAFKNIYNFS